MDLFSRKLLFYLDADARINISTLAKKMRCSPQRVHYTIQQLEKRNTICGYTTVFNYRTFGLNGYYIFFQAVYKTKDEYQILISYLKGQPEVVWIESIQGLWDLGVLILASNPSAFNAIFRRIMTEKTKMLKKYFIVTIIAIYAYDRDYLMPKIIAPKDFSILGGDSGALKLERNLMKISEQLLLSPDSTLKSLAKKTGLSFPTIVKGIKKLKCDQVITGFKPILNVETLHICSKHVMVSFSNFDAVLEEKLTSFCKNHPNIITLIRCFGRWDLILEFESLTEEEFRNFIFLLREKFEDIIDEYDVFPILKREKLQFLPTNVFSH